MDNETEVAGTWKAEQSVSASTHQYPKIKEDDNSAEMLRAEEAQLMQQLPSKSERAENIGDVDEAPTPKANTQSNPQNIENRENMIFELNADVLEEQPVVNPVNDLAEVQSSTLNADSSMTDPTAREYYYLMCLEHAAEENAKLDQKVQNLRTSLKKNQEKTQRAARRNINGSCGNISRSNYRNLWFNTKAALEEYSTELKSNPVEEERFKEYIERIQSGNHGPVTRAILRKVMTDDCAMNYNMLGRNRQTIHGVKTGYNKAAFEDLHIYHVIVEAVMNICKVSEGAVKTAVRNWLKAAPARRSHA